MSHSELDITTEPAKFKHAAAYVKSWLDSQAPQHLNEIELYFQEKLTNLAILIHQVREYFRGTKNEFVIRDVKQTSASSSSRSTGYKRIQPADGFVAPQQKAKAKKVENTTNQCPTCGCFHLKNATKKADGQCKFQVHPEASTQKQPDGTPTPWAWCRTRPCTRSPPCRCRPTRAA